MELTKTRHTDAERSPHIRLICPFARREDAIRALKESGIPFRLEDVDENGEERISWRETFPGGEEALPGLVLAGQRRKRAMTQAALSEAVGIPQRHISEMENGKRPIGKRSARKLARALRTDFRIFL